MHKPHNPLNRKPRNRITPLQPRIKRTHHQARRLRPLRYDLHTLHQVPLIQSPRRRPLIHPPQRLIQHIQIEMHMRPLEPLPLQHPIQLSPNSTFFAASPQMTSTPASVTAFLCASLTSRNPQYATLSKLTGTCPGTDAISAAQLRPHIIDAAIASRYPFTFVSGVSRSSCASIHNTFRSGTEECNPAATAALALQFPESTSGNERRDTAAATALAMRRRTSKVRPISPSKASTGPMLVKEMRARASSLEARLWERMRRGPEPTRCCVAVPLY